MQKWKCLSCRYIYNPEVGNPVGGIAQGLPFEDLPNDWACPVCGVPKDMFKKLEDESP
ncbi:MAG: rubredoxin [Candidatus Hadarchaeaceae archaeon]